MALAEGLLHISAADVAACGITPAEMNEAVEAGFLEAARGTGAMRPALSIPAEGPGSFRAKGGVLCGAGFAAVKWYGYYPQNNAAGLAEYRPLLLLNETARGFPVAIMDGELITTMRTAAISAVAARYLAKQGATRLGFVGLGTQARSHLRALRALFPIDCVLAHGRRAESVAAFADFVREEGVASFRSSDEPRQVLAEAEIVVTTVPRLSPRTGFLDAAWLARGAFACMVDSGVSWNAATLGLLDGLFSDDVAQSSSRAEPGDATTRNFAAGLAEVVGGTHPGRREAADRLGLLFSGTGLADAAAAVLVYRRATALGLGRMLPT